MNRDHQRYEPLPTTENADSTHVNNHVEMDDPPHYSEIEEGDTSLSQSNLSASTPPLPTWRYKPTSSVPPSYAAATTLPTYNDVELEKEHEARMEAVDQLFGLNSNLDETDEPRYNGIVVGNDCLFFFAFLVAFFFNWIGLLIGYFVMYNLAGRYGALAGFGFSLIKWFLYLRYSDCCQDYVLNQHVFLYWAINFFAFIITVKGIIAWLSVRRYRYFNFDTMEPNEE